MRMIYIVVHFPMTLHYTSARTLLFGFGSRTKHANQPNECLLTKAKHRNRTHERIMSQLHLSHDSTPSATTTDDATAAEELGEENPVQQPVDTTPASDSLDGDVTESASRHSRGFPSIEALGREVGAVVDMHWRAENATYRGRVVEKAEDGRVRVYYPCDGVHKWHGFDVDECTIEKLVEPAAHRLSSICKTADGYEGKVDPTTRWSYTLDADELEEHFRRCGESQWLANVARTGLWTPVPQGCVLGSLAKAVLYTGDAAAAEKIDADCEASVLAKDRLKFAATRAPTYGYAARKVHVDPLHVASEHAVLMQVSRAHTVTIQGGLVFDANEPEPLPLTRETLGRCIGGTYVDAVHRGYEFVPQATRRKRQQDLTRESDARKVGRGSMI